MVEGATPNRLTFGGSVGPRDLKPAAIRAGTRPDKLGGRAVCAGGPDGHDICRRSGSNNCYQSQVDLMHSQTNLGSQCVRRRLLRIVPHCVVMVR
jgi:hypothetical protein